MWQWPLFILGVGGVPVLVCAVTFWIRFIREGDRSGPGCFRSRSRGCTCPAWRNWYGLRKLLTGTAIFNVNCPLPEHRFVVTRMYN